ncbi:MAG TPA: hypothetical protein PLK80_08060 [bacterium]|nr:MAG: hypothetical protein BWY28_02785 [bacterium ADurb.Bin236]HOY61625.1 hypothetical protein [bacterium]HPI76677.1 hypothetical protein [bacterium]
MRFSIDTEPADGTPAGLSAAFKAAGTPPEKELALFAEHMKGRVVDAFDGGGYPEGAWKKSRRAGEEGKTLLETGRLRNGIIGSFKSGAWEMRYGSSDKRARLLFKGGKVLPRRAKALAVPLTKEAKRRRPSEYGDDLFPLKMGDSKKMFLARKRGKKGKIELLYILLKSVTLPPRKFPQPLEADMKYFERLLREKYEGAR